MSWARITDHLDLAENWLDNLPVGYRINFDFMDSFLQAYKERAYLLYPRFTGFDSIEFIVGEAFGSEFEQKLRDFIDACKNMFTTGAYQFVAKDEFLDPKINGQRLLEADFETLVGTEVKDLIWNADDLNDREFFRADLWSALYVLWRMMQYSREQKQVTGTQEDNRPYFPGVYRPDDPAADRNGHEYLGDYGGDISQPIPPYQSESFGTTVSRASTGNSYMEANLGALNNSASNNDDRREYYRFNQYIESSGWNLNRDYGNIDNDLQRSDNKIHLSAKKLADDSPVILDFNLYVTVYENYRRITINEEGYDDIVDSTTYEPFYSAFPASGANGVLSHDYNPASPIKTTENNQSVYQYDPYQGETKIDIVDPNFFMPNPVLNSPTPGATNLTYSIEHRMDFRDDIRNVIIDFNNPSLDYYVEDPPTP